MSRLGLLRGLTPFAMVGIGGLLGACARHALIQLATGLWGPAFPYGTLLVNLAGCLGLGFYLALTTERLVGRPATRLLLGTGFFGAFTTFSTFSLETLRLLETGSGALALLNVLASVALGLLATLLGIAAAQAI